MTGYGHQSYAESLEELGTPFFLKESRGWILKRKISNHEKKDAMGCYPFFVCANWAKLNNDLIELEMEADMVSLSLVTDPFGNYSEDDLNICFKDMMKLYKLHYVRDLRLPADYLIHPHHRRSIKRAMGVIRIERCENPDKFLSDWITLYDFLIKKHEVHGVANFSKNAFAKQFSVPGLAAFCAYFENQIVGMWLGYVQGGIVYYHLGAYNELGYEKRASFALFWEIIRYFKEQGLHWLSLGSGAGVYNASKNGLHRFKEGWATETRPVYFCGRIFNKENYEELCGRKGKLDNPYFPAYRGGEEFN